MGVDVRCPACHAHTRVPPDAVGRNIRCRKCNKPFRADPEGAAPKPPGNPQPKKRLLLFVAIGLFVLLIVLLIILRVTGVF